MIGRGRYALDENRTPVLVDDLMEWARRYEFDDRRVASSTIGDVRVSTVFLGLDHQFGEGPPLLFESMVFGGKFDGYQARYSTWAEAEAGHRIAFAMAREEIGGFVADETLMIEGKNNGESQ